MIRISRRQRSPRRKVTPAGFSLLELIVAMGVFAVVAGVSLTLFSRHETLLSQEQGFSGLNIGLRNSLSQIQMDVVNAGYGIIQDPNVPAWPVGVTIVNSNPTLAQCNPTATSPPTYTAACFDQLNIVMADANTPPVQPTTSITTSSGATTTITVTPATSNFKSGDQILLVTNSGQQFTTAVLSTAGVVSGTTVNLTFYSTLAGGANIAPTGCGATPSATCNDPLSMTVNAPATTLTNSFGTSDWVLRLLPIQYTVSVANSSDPQLTRSHAGNTAVVMDQVIGFKVGAAWWNSAISSSTFNYCYSTGAFCDPPTNSITGYNGDFTLVRSVRVTVIGRTMPSTNPLYTYENPFDSGHYQIRGDSIIVNPRNLTMNND